MDTTLNISRPRWFFYPGWIVLTVISIPIAWMITMAIMSQIIKVVGGTIQVGGQRHITEDFLLFYVFLPVLGLLTGLLQYLILRGYLRRMEWWIVATFPGWLLFSIVLRVPALLQTPFPVLIIVVLLVGSVAPQWILLRRRVRRAALWVLAFIVGWGTVLLFTGGGTISNQQEVLSVVLLPPVASSIAWWLILDKLPRRDGNGENSPSNALPELSEPL